MKLLDAAILLLVILSVALIKYLDMDFILAIFIADIILLILIFLIRKISYLLLFFAIGIASVILLNQFNLLQNTFFISFFIAGIIATLLNLLLDEHVMLYIIFSGIYMATIPFSILLLSRTYDYNLFILALNLSLLCFITGLIGGLIGLLATHRLMGNKKVIEFIYKQ